jgi:hypothetical protein
MRVVAKVNCIRLVLAFAVAAVMHCHLACAAYDEMGLLTEEEVERCVFLYHRLQGLLYPEEMDVVDRAVNVCCQEVRTRGAANSIRRSIFKRLFKMYTADAHMNRLGSTTYHTEVSRHCRSGNNAGAQRLLGREEAGYAEDSSVVPLPKIILPMVLRAVMQPLDMAWGYPRGLQNLFWRQCQAVMLSFAQMDDLICNPTPLAYLQHCRVLLVFFAICYPLSIDVSEGTLDNIIMPFAIFWAILGFDVLAYLMENPLGNKPTDVNLLQRVHALELQVEQAFNSTEMHADQLQRALLRPLEDFGLAAGLVGSSPVGSSPSPQAGTGRRSNDAGDRFIEASPQRPSLPADTPPLAGYSDDNPLRNFASYFHWVPIPTLILEGLVWDHGHAEVLNPRLLKEVVRSLRARFRLMRVQWRAHKDEGGTYHLVGADPPVAESNAVQSGPDEVQETPEHALEESVIEAHCKDPNIFADYLVFVGACRSGQLRQSLGAPPAEAVQPLPGIRSEGSRTPTAATGTPSAAQGLHDPCDSDSSGGEGDSD